MGKPNFKELRKKQIEQAKNGSAYKTTDSKQKFVDERIYKISKDSDGNGEATVRLIPSLNKDKNSLNTFVIRKIHNVNVKDDNGQKRFRSFLCKDKNCPVCQHGWDLYNTAKKEGAGKEDLKNILRTWLSTEELYTNVLILDDPVNNENNKKIKLFKLSKTILNICDKEAEDVNKTIEKANIYKESDPEKYEEILDDEWIPKDVDTFDAYDVFQNGKNLNLKFKSNNDASYKTPADYWGYSKLDKKFKTLCKTEEEFEQLINKTYCLDEFTNPDEFPDAKMKYLSDERLEAEISYLSFETDKVETASAETKDKQEAKEVKKPLKEKEVKETGKEVEKPIQEKEEVKKEETPKSDIDAAIDELFG